MRSSLVCAIDGVGEVLVEHSAKAKRLRIQVSPSGVRVAVPEGLALARGRDFALEKREWIRGHLGRMEALARVQEEALRGLPAVTDRVKAREKIVGRLRELSSLHGLSYARVMVRRQKTRWGSCSARGTISLNIALARLPKELMDYVILHELVHTRIRGHQRNFWAALDALTGDARALRRALRRYCLDLL